jgi:hypothetical protein
MMTANLPHLGPIAGATVLAFDFDATVQAYGRHLNYRVTASGRIDADTAAR